MSSAKQSKDKEGKDGVYTWKMFSGDIEQYKPVSEEEEKELIRRIHEGDESAKEKLAMSNIRFVIYIANKYQYLGLDQADLISEGFLGLYNAIEKYDETYGVEFLSYAEYWIRESILSALAKNGRTVKLPKDQISLIRKINQTIEDYKHKNGIKPTETEIADILDIAENVVSNAIKLPQKSISFDAPYKKDDEDNKFSPHDTIHSQNIDPEENLDNELKIEELKRALMYLPPSEQFVIGHLSGIRYDKSSLDEIATKLKRPKEKIQLIKEKGIRTLKAKTTEEITQEFLNRMKNK